MRYSYITQIHFKPGTISLLVRYCVKEARLSDTPELKCLNSFSSFSVFNCDKIYIT